MKLLDVFCCQGGSSFGYFLAGFEVTGVDKDPQPRFPEEEGLEFYQGDAIEFILKWGHEYDVITASPPCQAYSVTQSLHNNEHPDLIAATREAIQSIGKPYIIENVEGAWRHLHNPIMLCGGMFDLQFYRHRLFESSFKLHAPYHPKHYAKAMKLGRKRKAGENLIAVGHFNNVDEARIFMGMPWASQHGLAEAIPPIYTKYLGEQIIGSFK